MLNALLSCPVSSCGGLVLPAVSIAFWLLGNYYRMGLWPGSDAAGSLL
jgi:hypothetical protein